MLKFTKIVFVAVLMVFTMLSANVGQCAKDQTPKYGADKAILAYAEVYAFGYSKDSKYIGLSKDDISEFERQVAAKFADDFKDFCLNEESLNELTDIYVKKFKSDMKIKTTFKEKSKETPVINLTANILNSESFDNQAKNDKKLQELRSSILGMKNGGKTDAELMEDSAFQEKAVDCITNFINALSINQKKTLSVKCKNITGEDGKTYWTPEDPEVVMNFIQGK